MAKKNRETKYNIQLIIMSVLSINFYKLLHNYNFKSVHL